MNCVQVGTMLSPYLDGMLTGKEMLALGEHLEQCRGCRHRFVSLRQTQQMLSKVGRRTVPEDVSLKLRLAISREVSLSRTPYFQHLWIRVEDAIQGLMVPVTVGLVSAVVIFGFLMGFLALPLQAGSTDVPLVFATAPQFEQSAFGSALASLNDDSLVIEAYVDSNGRVEDYRVLSNPQQPKELPTQIKNMLIFTTFRPATLMGRPTAGKAVLSFSKISVKG